jgi:signal transduction histidine kinase
MRPAILHAVQLLTLAQRFMLVNLLIVLVAMAGVGWWVSEQIKEGVAQRSATTTALYVESQVAPRLHDLEAENTLTTAQAERLDWLLKDTALAEQIAAFKLWAPDGTILYSLQPALVGQQFAVEGDLARAWNGEVTAEISKLEQDENVLERQQSSELLEIYIPVRNRDSNEITAVAELYFHVEDLARSIREAQRRSWLVVGLATAMIYLFLNGMVRRASDLIARQRDELERSVAQLQQLLQQNEELRERVTRAAARTTALNERYLRRISAELHDGPAQDVGLALLRLDNLATYATSSVPSHSSDLDTVRGSLQHAMSELRTIATGLRLPELDLLTLSETIQRVSHTHGRRTRTQVGVDLARVPEQAPLPVKITLYRLIQEALNNAYRHAEGVGQQVTVSGEPGYLKVEISDRGPGLVRNGYVHSDERLGLVGMRERVESLGGQFTVRSVLGQGTTIEAWLPLEPAGEEDES